MARWLKYLLVVLLILHGSLLAVYLTSKDLISQATIYRYMYNESLVTLSNVTDPDFRPSFVAITSGGRVNTSITTGSPSTIPGVFQSIDHQQAWLYSAFYDHVAAKNGKPLVRAFGVVKKMWCKKIYCTLSTEDKSFNSTGVIIALPGSHNMMYLPAYLECPLANNERPTQVSVSFQTKDKPTNRLQIIYPGPRIINFTVCYSVLHSGYNKPTQLIESIEMNRILGAEHFMVYNYSISPAVDQILRRYQEDGLVTVLPWVVPTLESHYFAQMTALNDCSYRNRNTSRFMVVLDTDELLVPRSHYTWMELIHSVSPQETDVSIFMNRSDSSKKKTLTGSFMVRSSFFYINSAPNWDSLSSSLNFTDDEKKNIIKYNILTLSQTKRQVRIFPQRERSKYISRPDLVYISGVHEVHQFINSFGCNQVSENTALVHHYREANVDIRNVNDTSMLKFKSTLYPHVIEQIKRFTQIFP